MHFNPVLTKQVQELYCSKKTKNYYFQNLICNGSNVGSSSNIRSIKLIMINKSFTRPYLENLIADHFLRKLKMFSIEHV